MSLRVKFGILLLTLLAYACGHDPLPPAQASSCPQRLDPPVWAAYDDALHGSASLLCALAPNTPSSCVSQMGFALDVGGGMQSIGATSGSIVRWDTTRVSNGFHTLLCFPIGFDGLGYSDPSAMVVLVHN